MMEGRRIPRNRSREAWTALRDELRAILGDELVAIWAYGSTIGADRPRRPADLDTHVVIRRKPDGPTVERIERATAAIAAGGQEWDTWYVTLDDARGSAHPKQAIRAGRTDEAWALHRAHWLAGRVLVVHGQSPAEIVAPPTWPELLHDLRLELEHLERHVRAGDTDPSEAAYALLNGSRILRSLEVRDVVLSKREAGQWALRRLPDRWQPAMEAALRAYDAQATPADADLLAAEMRPFVEMVRERFGADAG